jgi:hypothetical protein
VPESLHALKIERRRRRLFPVRFPGPFLRDVIRIHELDRRAKLLNDSCLVNKKQMAVRTRHH